MNPTDVLPPDATLDTVITIEWFLLIGVGALFVLFGWSYLDGRAARGRIYKEVKEGMEATRKDITDLGSSLRQEIKEQGREQAKALREHEDKCDAQRRLDDRWRGRVDQKLGLHDD